MYLNNHLTPSAEFRFSDSSNSAAAVYIKQTHTVLGVVYRAPLTPLGVLLDDLSHFVDQFEVDSTSPDIYLVGDFNFPDIIWDSYSGGPDPSSLGLLKFVETHFLHQLVKCPTRGSNILDLVFTNRPDYVLETVVSESFVSDHRMVASTLGFGLSPKPQCDNHFEDFFVYNFHEADFPAMCRDLDSVDWDELFALCRDSDDGSDFTELLTLTVLQVLSHHSRRKRKPRSKRSDPILRQLKIKQRKLNKRLTTARQLNSPSLVQLERAVSRVTIQILGHISQGLDSDELSALQKLKLNPRFFWAYANKRRKTKSRIPPLQASDGTLTDIASDKAELFQSQFTSVFSEPSSSPSSAAASIPLATSSLCEITFTPSDIVKALAELNPYSAGPPGCIPARILKECRTSLAYPLFLLWSRSFEDGVVPSCLKRQYISPLYKKGAKTCAANYRPVSLTSHIAKTFERVVRSQMMSYFESENLFNNSQHGF